MSHGPPPSRASLYGGYGHGPMGVSAGLSTPQVRLRFSFSADQHDMMSMLESSMFGPYDGMSMAMDVNDPVAQPFAPSVTQSSNTALAGPADQPFSDDGVAMSAAGSMAVTPITSGPVVAGGGGGGTLIGPGAGVGAGANNTLTEFTKRRNWPARVVEELKDILQILDADGRIKHVSPSIEPLTGYKMADLQDLFLKDLLHPDDVGVFTSEMNECIASGVQLRILYRFKKKDGNYMTFESVGHAHIATAKFAPNPNNQSPFCQAVFVMSRPYPTKNAGLLDSFLEHKIENERLSRKIAELRREEADEAEESQRTWHQSQEGRSDFAPSESATSAIVALVGGAPFGLGTISDPLSMPPPERPSSLNIALTRENLEGIAGGRPDSIREKMARYEGSTAETIEMLTGLRYQEGERSRGITTGNASPTLIKGDAGIAIPMDRDPRTGEKKKKLKMAEEYVCTDCGTLDSPEWRKGPSGPKTLCNACGLRWAKKEKKKSTHAGAVLESLAIDNMG
ncbi:putative white collar 2 protein [Bombardia bombarda]|uniref:White collar 2 protein n=1 Tax=Bombardia bombarda TaxID=252184 RepID=A0AA40C539_9PEZI|nr:putative white collar 2 protein [Bombardia bombarda]